MIAPVSTFPRVPAIIHVADTSIYPTSGITAGASTANKTLSAATFAPCLTIAPRLPKIRTVPFAYVA